MSSCGCLDKKSEYLKKKYRKRNPVILLCNGDFEKYDILFIFEISQQFLGDMKMSVK